MTVPAYDYEWRAMRRVCDVLADAGRGVAHELADIFASDASLSELDIPAPTSFVPLDAESEIATLRSADNNIVCVYPGAELSRVQMLGDEESRTDEVVWELVAAVRLVREAGNAELSESWADVDMEVRERRRARVLMGAVAAVLSRDARDGVNVLTCIPASKPEHGVQIDAERRQTVRWSRQRFEVLQHVLVPQFALSVP